MRAKTKQAPAGSSLRVLLVDDQQQVDQGRLCQTPSAKFAFDCDQYDRISCLDYPAALPPFGRGILATGWSGG